MPKPGEPWDQALVKSTLPGNEYGLQAGTSMAAPSVTGGAAVLREAFPYMTARQIIELMLTTARESGPKEIYGRGMFDLGRAIQGPKYFGDPFFSEKFDVDTKGYDSAWWGDIGGPGGLIKRGKGNLVLSGTNTYEGGTELKGGALTLLGTLGSDVVLREKATLRGLGVIAADLDASGTVAPGGERNGTIGSLLVNGKVILGDTSVLRVDVADDKADRLVAVDDPGSKAHPSTEAGMVTLEKGKLDVRLKDGLAPVEKPAAIVVTQNGVTGAFGTLSTNSVSAYLEPSLIYDQNVELTFERNDTTFESAARTPNQSAVARALDGATDGKPWEHAAQQSVKGARLAFDSFSGEIHASSISALVGESHLLADAAINRLRIAEGAAKSGDTPVMAFGPDGPEPAAADDERLVAWVTVLGRQSRFDGDGNAAALKGETRGFVADVDFAFGDAWRFGLLGGIGSSEFTAGKRASKTEADALRLGLYGSGRWDALSLRGGLAYSWLDLETERAVRIPGLNETLRADYDAGMIQAFGEAAWEMEYGAVSFEPFAGIGYVGLDTGRFSESGGTTGLSSSGDRFDIGFTTLGLRASTATTIGHVPVSVSGKLGWRHAFGDHRPETALSFKDGPGFTVTGLPLARNEALASANLAFTLSDKATLNLSYDGAFSSTTRTNTLSLGLNVKF